MTNWQTLVDDINNEINGQNREEEILKLENIASKHISNITKEDSFFTIPLKNILSITNKTDFNECEDDPIDTIKRIINGTINSHPNERETLYLLHELKRDKLPPLTINDCISILESFTNIDICVILGELSKAENKSVEIDYDYEISQLQKQVKTLENMNSTLEKQIKSKNETISRLGSKSYEPIFPPITQKPKRFESDILNATLNEDFPSIQWLIEQEHVDIDTTDTHDETSLYYAASFGFLDIVQYLIQKGADVNKADDGQRTPLHEASDGGYVDIVQYLVDHGAYINAIDEWGDTPLHNASYYGNVDVVRYLLSKGANKSIKNKDGETAWYIACIGFGADQLNKNEIQNLLI